MGPQLPASKLSNLSICGTEVVDLGVAWIIYSQWIIRRSLTGLQQLLIWLCMHHRSLMLHTHTHTPLQRDIIIFKELFINFFSPGKTMNLSRRGHCAIWSPNAVGKVPGCFTSLLMNIWATQQLTLSDHIFFPLVVVVVHGVAVMSSSGCQKGSACSCGGSPQSLSHSLFPWQSFRQHHRQAVCKDPYNLFFQQPLLWCSAPERASNYQVQRERTLHPFSITVRCCFTRRCIVKKKILIWIKHYTQLLLSNCYMCFAVKVLWPTMWDTTHTVGHTHVNFLMPQYLFLLYHLKIKSQKPAAASQTT